MLHAELNCYYHKTYKGELKLQKISYLKFLQERERESEREREKSSSDYLVGECNFWCGLFIFDVEEVQFIEFMFVGLVELTTI